jgi:hypothetical protein
MNSCSVLWFAYTLFATGFIVGSGSRFSDLDPDPLVMLIFHINRFFLNVSGLSPSQL